MKILAIADRPLQESISALIQENNIDLVVTLGDLSYLALRELENITHIPKLGVYGNHCSGDYFEPLGIINMHLNTFEYKGVTFGGFESCLKYKESKYAKMYTQEQASSLMNDFPYVDVMLCHSPPYGINDEPKSLSHQGFIALRDYVDNKKPKFLFHGHTYPSENTFASVYYETTIVYVYKKGIFEI